MRLFLLPAEKVLMTLESTPDSQETEPCRHFHLRLHLRLHTKGLAFEFEALDVSGWRLTRMEVEE
jgi:hypothetical protein